MQITGDNWAEGTAYDAYMGRWSREVAKAFVHWLEAPAHLRWLDVGCGTGALANAVVQAADPELVIGCDPSVPFIAYASAQQNDPRLSFQAATLGDLPEVPGGFAVIVSGLVLNFIADPVEAIMSMMKRAHPGGLVAAYVWDYAGRMDFLRIFWDAAVTLDPVAYSLDEGRRFPLCQPELLGRTFRDAGLAKVRTDAIDIPTVFKTFADYWEPFLAGTGPAPNYVASLGASERERLKTYLEQRLDPAAGGEFQMIARAWAVRGEIV